MFGDWICIRDNTSGSQSDTTKTVSAILFVYQFKELAWKGIRYGKEDNEG